MRIFQISGMGRVGKTTLAKLIAKYTFELDYIPVLIPFADSIKKQAEQQGITKESDSSKYREFCQTLGASRRKEDPDYWVVRTDETIQEYMIKELDNKKNGRKYFEYVIIQDDVRYMNELALGRRYAATQIFICSGDRTLEEHNAEWRNHESEQMANLIDEVISTKPDDFEETFDIIIINDESEKNLEKMVKENIEDWLKIGFLDLEEVNEEADQGNS